ncbi:MAG: PP2C family protein-serine/threonine phosphatase [Terriglobia bacterium]
MRDRIYLAGLLVGAGLLLYAGHGLFEKSRYVAFALTFGVTTAAAVLGVALYKVQLELRASRRELARKEAELNIAFEVQKGLFPRSFPSGGGLEFSGICVPAKGISGDYYDVLQLANGRLIFVVADISGKGVSAAILMSNLQAVLRTLAEAGHSPCEVCAHLNRRLYQVTEDSRFATFFYGEWNPASRLLRYINAGHPLPFLCGTRRGLRLDRGGPPIGLFQDLNFEAGEVELQPGDLLVVYSDGIVEAGIGQKQEFGESRLERIIKAHCSQSLAEIQRQVLAAVRDWSGPDPEDDMTLLLVKALPLAEEGA